MAVAYEHSERPEDGATYASTIRAGQQISATGRYVGGTPASSHDGVTSGFGFKLFRRQHLGATAWNVFAQVGFNPYDQTRVAPSGK